MASWENRWSWLGLVQSLELLTLKKLEHQISTPVRASVGSPCQAAFSIPRNESG